MKRSGPRALGHTKSDRGRLSCKGVELDELCNHGMIVMKNKQTK